MHKQAGQMNYQQAINYLNSLGRFGMHFGLERMEKMMEHLGNPHQKLKAIHITGTNGKGSTAMMIGSILKKAGYKVGVYTSPHLDDFRERIQINDKFISKEDVARITEKIKPITQKTLAETGSNPTFFEVVTAIALKYFSDEGVDYLVLEVGLGGRLDATNVVNSKVCIITNIDYEHTDILGNSLSSIAKEKGGIIKNGAFVITSETKKEVLHILEKICKEKNAKLFKIQKEFEITKIESDSEKNIFNIESKFYSYKKLIVPLIGEHQIINASMAIAAVKSLDKNIDKKSIQEGLVKTHWPGRLEIISRKPLIVMDAAHNPAAMRQLVNSLKLFNYKRMILVFGVMKDKDIKKIMKIIAPKASITIINKPRVERAAEPKLIQKYARKFSETIIIKDVKKSIRYAKSIASKGDLICVTGSIYMLSEARAKKSLKRLAQ
jgi:dihydrofolate synthase/folylpolyglutamate synthase